jgi:hypothetical protein
MDEFDLVPNERVGPAHFGLRPAQVTSVMGETELYEDWMGGNLNDSLLFRGLILGFDRCDANGPLPDGRLIEARVKDDQAPAFSGSESIRGAGVISSSFFVSRATMLETHRPRWRCLLSDWGCPSMSTEFWTMLRFGNHSR